MNNTIAYVTNTKTGETTRYSNHAFDQVLKFNGLHYGITATGIYLLSGSDDAGTAINASFDLAKTDFGTSRLKRVPYVFVDTDNETAITPTVDSVDHPSYVSNYAGKRTKLGRGINGRYWSLKFESVAGAAFNIKGVELEPEVMNRRIS